MKSKLYYLNLNKMKKVLFVLAAAACMVACGTKNAENTEAAAEEVAVEEVAAEEVAEEATLEEVVEEAAVEVVEAAADAAIEALGK